MSIRKLLLALSIFYSAVSFAQVGVGTVVPNSSTMLDVVASDKGVLLPRVQLNNSTDATTIVPQNEVGLLVYNTTAMADIGVGYHFWDGAKWVAMRTEGLSSGTGDPNGNGPAGEAGDIYVDESTGDIYIHDGNTWISSSINETTTTLADNGNGTFTYTSEDGTATTFDVTQSGTGDPNTNGTTAGAGAVYVDEQGRYSFADEFCGNVTIIRINEKDYFPNETVVSGVDGGVVQTDIQLDKPDPIREAIETGTVTDLAIFIDPIYFDYGKSFIRPDASIELDKIVDILNDYPAMEIDVRSHTDSRSSDSFNMNLSNQRAQATIYYLVRKGIKINRLTGRGYGETQLVNRCSNGVQCSNDEHQQNRRSEFIITKK